MHPDGLTRLLLDARDGDRDAAAQFVRATQAEVWRMCAALGARGQADDLTQDTYLRAFGSLRRFAGRSSARTWLLSIARRVCADSIRVAVRDRAHRADAAALDDAHSDSGESESPRARLAAAPSPDADLGDSLALRELLGALPEAQREAFALTQIIGLSYEEAAAVCGCPIGTIRSRVARAREALLGGWNAGTTGLRSVGG